MVELTSLSMGDLQDPNMEVRKRTICLAIFPGDIPLHSPYIGLIYGRYLHFRILKWPLKFGSFFFPCSFAVMAPNSYKWFFTTPITKVL